MKTKSDPADQALRTLEADLGEPLLFRTTGRLLAAEGLGDVPLGAWGLVALTPTRVVFHHFSNPHPLSFAKDAEVRWTGDRSRFEACAARSQGFWARLLSSVPDHLVLTGPGVSLAVEVADFPRRFVEAWGTRVSP